MKLTATESALVQEMVDWYVDAAAGLWKEAERNAAFFQATNVAMDGLNTEANRRFTFAFSKLVNASEARTNEVRAELARAIRSRLNVGKSQPAGDAIMKLVEPRSADLSIENYLHVMTSCLHAARQEEGALRVLDGPHSDRAVGLQFSRMLWAALRNARVFDLPVKDFVAMWRAADIYTTEKIAKRPWVSMEDGEANPPDNTGFTAAIDEAGRRVPFPEQLPFEFTYIGLGHGQALAEHQWGVRLHAAETRSRVIGVCLLGYLIWPGSSGAGEAVELLQVVEVEDNYILPNLICHDGFWIDPMITLGPWLVTHMVGLINEHRQIVLQPHRPSFSQRRDWEKKGKQLKVPGLVPKPYYVIRLEKKLIEDTGHRNRERLAKISRELAYRHDRRGHERCYVRRGQLPIDPKDSKKLEDAGYKVWTMTEPDSNAYRQLMERNQPPKGTSEWIAILTKWIDPTVVGSDDKPYIPAIRVPSSTGGSLAGPHKTID